MTTRRSEGYNERVVYFSKKHDIRSGATLCLPNL
jgi:hypothetical protein